MHFEHFFVEPQLHWQKDSTSHQKTMSPMYTYLHNSYNTPTMLYLENGGHSGVTQGDNTAMAMHALSTQPLIQLTSIKQQMMM